MGYSDIIRTPQTEPTTKTLSAGPGQCFKLADVRPGRQLSAQTACVGTPVN